MINKLPYIVLLLICVPSCDSEPEDEQLPIACFTHTEASIFSDSVSQTTYTPAEFSNCSEHASDYFWDFDDGTTSILAEPTHTFTEAGEYIVSLTASNDFGTDVEIDTLYVDWAAVDKPNIYIYPDSAQDLTVELVFPQGGRIIKSEPQVENNSWNVNVETSGRIDGTYDFLFYESIQPDVWQYDNGWCVSVDTLESFFSSNLSRYNFSDKEISDFTEFWIPILNEHDFYNIYPQTNERISTVIQLNLSSQPHHIFRLFYRIVGTDSFEHIPPVQIEHVEREGFHVFEWGVIRE